MNIPGDNSNDFFSTGTYGNHFLIQHTDKSAKHPDIVSELKQQRKMKTGIHHFCIVPFICLVISCGRTTQRPENKPVPVERLMERTGPLVQIEISKLVSPIDTICGMSLVEGIADTLNLDGKLYGFCSTGCKQSFVKRINSK